MHQPHRSLRLTRRPAGLALGAVLALTLTTSGVHAVPERSFVPVIVRAGAGAQASTAAEVARLGGRIGTALGIINGFAASVPADVVPAISRIAGVTVTPDASVQLSHTVDGLDAQNDPGSLYSTAKSIKAHDVWKQGITGAGVDVALIDSGVVPVNGLTTPGKVVNGPDLSFDSQSDNLRYVDTYGHGTHMAGIIAGRDGGVATVADMTNHDNFVGIAPDARIVNVKVANAVGATDVSQVIAAIDWIVQHRNDGGLNIRVLNLSFGTDGTQDYSIDPLAFAAEVAWRRGIFVVVAAGNAGNTGLTNPARDPYVLAVGADDGKGSYNTNDDSVPAWSSRGDVRRPDLIAPGKSIVSLRDAGSYVDGQFPEGRVNTRFTRGSGTSQAAAVMSGAAALLIQQRPHITPDELKRLLTSSASPLSGVSSEAQGAGVVNLAAAASAPTPSYEQTWPTSSGTGSLEAARGSMHVVAPDGTALTGEQDIFGNAWVPGTSWSSTSWTPGTSWSGTSWSGGQWNGTSWSGSCWCGTSWSGTSWSGTSWSGTSWSGTSWSGTSWSGTSWSGTSWSGTSWSGTSWSGTSWSNAIWGR